MKEFLGREEELGRISSHFSAYAVQRPHIAVLQAIGGQGKSQIALEYCQRAKQIYGGLFWVNAITESAMIQPFAGIAREIDQPAVASRNDKETVKFVQEALEGWEERWLMVFDNCDDIKSFPQLE